MGFGYYDSEESKSDASIREREIPFCEKELFLVLVFCRMMHIFDVVCLVAGFVN